MTLNDIEREWYFIEVHLTDQPGVSFFYENEEGFCIWDPTPYEGRCVLDIKEATLIETLEEARKIAQRVKKWKNISSVALVKWRMVTHITPPQRVSNGN